MILKEHLNVLSAIRFPSVFHSQIQQVAARHHITFSAYVRLAIAEKMNRARHAASSKL